MEPWIYTVDKFAVKLTSINLSSYLKTVQSRRLLPSSFYCCILAVLLFQIFETWKITVCNIVGYVCQDPIFTLHFLHLYTKWILFAITSLQFNTPEVYLCSWFVCFFLYVTTQSCYSGFKHLHVNVPGYLLKNYINEMILMWKWKLCLNFFFFPQYSANVKRKQSDLCFLIILCTTIFRQIIKQIYFYAKWLSMSISLTNRFLK